MKKYINSSMFNYILSELDLYPPLKYDEEVSLFMKSSNGDTSAREKLIKHNMRLVFSVVTKLSFVDENNFEDYFQNGMSGLMDAVDMYDYAHGNKFSTYAVKCVYNYIKRYYYKYERAVRYPINMYENKEKVLNKIDSLLKQGYTYLEISEKLNMEFDYLMSYLRINDIPISIFDKRNDEDGKPLEDYIASPNSSPESIMIDDLICKKINDLISSGFLTEKEEKVIKCLYLHAGNHEITAASLSREFGCTRQYIKNIERIAFRKIRQNKKTDELAGICGDEKKDKKALEIMREYYKDRKGKKKSMNGVIGVENGEIVSLSRKITNKGV